MLYGVASNTTYTYTAKTGDKCLLGKGAGEFPAGKALDYLVCSTALRGEDKRPSHPHTTVSDVSGAGVERFLSGRFCSRRHLELRQAPGQRLRLADGRPR